MQMITDFQVEPFPCKSHFFIQKGWIFLLLPWNLNADLGSHSFQLMKPNYRFKDIKWSKDLPSETFSFYACEIKLSSERQTYKSWIYWPHPSTKPEFKQKKIFLKFCSLHWIDFLWLKNLAVSKKGADLISKIRLKRLKFIQSGVFDLLFSSFENTSESS